MSTPGHSRASSPPVRIRPSGRRDDNSTPLLTPPLPSDSLGLPGSFGTPPPNIPPRLVSRQGVGSSPRLGGAFGSPPRGSPLISGSASPVGGLEERGRSGTPAPKDLDDLPDEEKARVLRKHLVSREERVNSRQPSVTRDSVTRPQTSDVHIAASQSGPSSIHKVDEDEFPSPFSHPGGDIT